jgi:hypothetical protein
MVTIDPQLNDDDPCGKEWPKDEDTGMVVLQPGQSVSGAADGIAFLRFLRRCGRMALTRFPKPSSPGGSGPERFDPAQARLVQWRVRRIVRGPRKNWLRAPTYANPGRHGID